MLTSLRLARSHWTRRVAIRASHGYGSCFVPSSPLATFALHTPKARSLSSSAVALAFELRSTSYSVVQGSCSTQAPIAPTSFSVVLHSAGSTPPSLGAPTSYSVVHGSCSTQAPIAPTSYLTSENTLVFSQKPILQSQM